jgi:two-component system cell cycle sensor histidine kinase/response regulator CckA
MAQLAPRRVSSNGPTVLVVEPVCAVRAVIARLLGEAGYNVITADSAAQALERLSVESHVDLVLTEVVMPRLGGAKLGAHIRRDHPGTRVLYMTGWFDDIVEGYGIVESRVEMLRKPFGPRELRDKVSRVLGARNRWVSCQSAA